MRKQQRDEILKVLEETYKDTKTALNYNSPFELLVAVIMSAQCTDERVNKITARIFPKYNTPEKNGRAYAGRTGKRNPRLRPFPRQSQKPSGNMPYAGAGIQQHRARYH